MAKFSLITSRNLTACHAPIKRGNLFLVPKYFFGRGTKRPLGARRGR